MSLQERLMETCKDMSEDMLAEVINFAEYVQHKNDVQNNSKGEEIKMEKEKMVEFKNLVEETCEGIKEIIKLVKTDEDFKKIDSFDIFKEEGNSDIVHDLLADFTDAIQIIQKEA
ncbi:hypothetical protein KQI41_17450 [Tissierella pigra]|uniref:hypothetical protein n=1 Tax=Tissierella pigra TaxID=2607614 RepID=UPI001C121806|nr:hypothetical protein [Tissierella pigra]MBU5428183.1 hypothetical protein [Tissierella pigra]